MKPIRMVIALFLFLLIATAFTLYPDQAFKESRPETHQIVSQKKSSLLKINYRVQNTSEEPIADIIWMKKAAEVASQRGLPYFNVLKQNIRRSVSEDEGKKLIVVSGIIKLESDPLNAQFDAQEILSLILPNTH